MKDNRYFTGGNGTYYIGTSAQTGKNYMYIVINTAAKISVLKDVDGNDYVSTLGIGAKQIEAGMIIRLPDGLNINEITLTQGDAFGIADDNV